MSMRKKSVHFSIPGVIDEYLEALMDEIGLDKSALVTEMVFYISMPENLEDFKSKFNFEGAGEDEDENEDDDEDEANDPLGIFRDVDEDEEG